MAVTSSCRSWLDFVEIEMKFLEMMMRILFATDDLLGEAVARGQPVLAQVASERQEASGGPREQWSRSATSHLHLHPMLASAFIILMRRSERKFVGLVLFSLVCS